MASVSKREWTSPKGEKKSAWEVRWLHDGKHNSKGGFATKKAADIYKRKVEREIEDGTHTIPSQAATIEYVCDLYYKQAEDRLRDGRLGRSQHMHVRVAINRSILPYMGSLRMVDLTPVKIEDWYQWMVREGRLKPTTARSRVGIFKLIEEFAVRRGFTKLAVTTKANRDLSGIEQDKVRTFTAEQVAELLALASERGDRQKRRGFALIRCFVNIAAFGGLRWGEIMALTVENVLLDKRVLRVRHNLTDWDELKGPKTRAGVRDVPIPQRTADALRDYITEFYVENDRGLIFRTATGGRITRCNFHRQAWQPLLKRAGLVGKTRDWYHFHALRHFAASWMIENGLPVTEVASLLGHSKFDMTLQVYAHPVAGGHRRQSVMDQMAASLPAHVPQSSCARLSHAALSA